MNEKRLAEEKAAEDLKKSQKISIIAIIIIVVVGIAISVINN